MMFEIDTKRILKLAGLLESEEDDYDNHSDHSNALGRTGFWGREGAGCIFFAQSTGKFLINHRSYSVLEPGEFGVWGGAMDRGETPENAVRREVSEEAGYHGAYKLIPIFVFQKESFRYSNFIAVVEEEFTPVLDWESQGFVWAEFGKFPKPMHFGVKAILNDPKSVEIMKNLVANATKPKKKNEIDFPN